MKMKTKTKGLTERQSASVVAALRLLLVESSSLLASASEPPLAEGEVGSVVS